MDTSQKKTNNVCMYHIYHTGPYQQQVLRIEKQARPEAQEVVDGEQQEYAEGAGSVELELALGIK